MDQKRSLTVREKNDEYVDSFDRDMSFHPNFEYFLSLVNTEITLEVDKATTIEFVDKILGFIQTKSIKNIENTVKLSMIIEGKPSQAFLKSFEK